MGVALKDVRLDPVDMVSDNWEEGLIIRREAARDAGAVEYILEENLLDIVPHIQRRKKE